jgi:hypothetical protein
MPPKTRRSRGPAAQATLSFNNKITKSHIANPLEKTSKSNSKARLSDPVVKEALVEEISEPDPIPALGSIGPLEATSTDDTAKQQAAEPSSPVLRKKKRVSSGSVASQSAIAREAAAEKITDAQIRKYWKNEEESRLAPRGKSHSFNPHLIKYQPIRFSTSSCYHIKLINPKSPPTVRAPAREDPATFRSLLAIRLVYWDHAPEQMEARGQSGSGAAAGGSCCAAARGRG